MASDNVVYGTFGQTRSIGTVEKPTEGTAISQHTPSSLEQRFSSQIAVLRDLAGLLADPSLPVEVSTGLHDQLRVLKESADKIKAKLEQAHTNDQVFLEVQPEIAAFGKQLIAFEADVLDKTGASIELIEPPKQPNTAMQLKNKLMASPSFWIALSVGVGALGALAYWQLNKKPKRHLRGDDDAPNKFKKVKLRRALAAR